MRKSMAIVGVVNAVLLLALAGAAGSAASDERVRQFIVTAQDSEATFEPADFTERFAPGLQVIEDAPVYRDGEKVGLAETIITIIRADGEDVIGIIECSVELPEGNVFFNGSFHFADLGTGATIPVVGGTGEYAGFLGTVTAIASEDGSATDLAFDLRRP